MGVLILYQSLNISTPHPPISICPLLCSTARSPTTITLYSTRGKTSEGTPVQACLLPSSTSTAALVTVLKMQIRCLQDRNLRRSRRKPTLYDRTSKMVGDLPQVLL